MKNTKKKNGAAKGKGRAALSAQQTIPYLSMHPDGVCKLPGGLYAKESRAGAGALIEIFKSVGVLSEVDGKLSVLDEPSSARVSVASNTISAEQTHSEPVAQQALPVATISAKNSIVINININCTPADIDGLGEKISQLLYELSE